MIKHAQNFIASWVITCAVLATFLALFIRLMDPYLTFDTPRIAGLNSLKPAALSQERLVKAYDVIRVAPAAAILGSSRVDAGFATRNSVRSDPDSVIYNLGLGAGSPYISYRYLQHVASRHKVSLVLVGLDFEYFLTAEQGAPRGADEFESYLSITRNGRANPDRTWQYAFSLDGLVGSFETLSANIQRKSPSDFISDGNWAFKATRSNILATSAYPRVAWIDVVFSRSYLKPRRARLDSAALGDVQLILDLCESKSTQLILFINPIHADMLEIIDRAGYWPEFESWKRELASMTARYNRGHGHERAVLWDFSSYDIYTTEPISGARPLRWFRESSHYSPELGDLILRRLLGMDQGDFGTLLLPETLHPHLAYIREQQRRYREQHPQEVRRVHEWYDAVADNVRSRKSE